MVQEGVDLKDIKWSQHWSMSLLYMSFIHLLLGINSPGRFLSRHVHSTLSLWSLERQWLIRSVNWWKTSKDSANVAIICRSPTTTCTVSERELVVEQCWSVFFSRLSQHGSGNAGTHRWERENHREISSKVRRDLSIDQRASRTWEGNPVVAHRRWLSPIGRSGEAFMRREETHTDGKDRD